jgi:D-alanyl-D-alanine endopeptidase (penicillin-binding protein 7)
MKISIKFFFAYLFIIGILVPQTVFVATADEFNPNFILSDEEMQDWKTMDKVGIQAFLDERESFLSTYRTLDKDGTERSASEIIYNASVDNKINPKYLLVKLQKEQSLITAKNPTEKQLDGATGYGITDGCGWTCETYFRNQGFGKQVDSAAGIIRWYYDNVFSQTWIKRPPLTYEIDGQLITPATLATAFLYTYTPHIQGNKNFWVLWQSWFDQVYPDGSLIQATGSNDVYLIQDGKKRKFASFSALATRYNPKQILSIPPSELSRYDNGVDISLPNYSVVKADGTYYLLDYDTKRPFANSTTVGKLGFNPAEVLDVTSSELSSYMTGSTIVESTANPLGELVRIQENNTLYFLQDNQYFPMYDEAIIQTNFSHLTLETSPISRLTNLIQGPAVKVKDGALIMVQDDRRVYVVEKGKKRHITNEAVFNGLGYKWANIVVVNPYTSIGMEDGEPVYLRSTAPIPPTVTAPVVTAPTTPPVSAPTAPAVDVMIRTPESRLSYIGPSFVTDIDSYIVTDPTTGAILAGKNIDTVRPSASLTKIMTGYQLLQSGIDLNGSTTYNATTHAIADKSFVQYRVKTGEVIRNSDIMDAMLISSINAAARMLVTSVSTETNFLSTMNSQVASWGLTKTKFLDVYGGAIHNDTTSREFATLFLNTLKQKDLKTYLGKASYRYDELVDVDGYPGHFDAHSNLLIKDSNLSFSILASKTGYINEAGDNLAMLVERKSDKRQFIIITLGNPDHSNRFVAPKALSEWVMKTL